MPLLINIQKLSIINELIEVGATNVAASFSTLAGTETTVDIQSLAFADPVDLPEAMGDDECYVATIQLTEPPYGVFMLTFSDETARKVAELLSGQSVGEELNELQESALQEMCNICTSGFIDGIANVLDTTIDMGTPTLSQDGRETLRDELSHVRDEGVAIYLDSIVSVPEHDTDLELQLYLVPAPGPFVNLLDTIELGA
jgi:chemotaxis protein CheC